MSTSYSDVLASALTEVSRGTKAIDWELLANAPVLSPRVCADQAKRIKQLANTLQALAQILLLPRTEETNGA